MTNLKLKSSIIAKHGSQGDFSQEIGVAECIISRVVNNRHSLDEPERERWAKSLGVEVHELFGEPVKISA